MAGSKTTKNADRAHYDEQPHRLDPDVRFLLANERTLLAWIRTGLTLQAGGLALTQLKDTRQAGSFGIAIVLLGATTAGIGYIRYRSADAAIRTGKLPRPGAGPVVEVAIIVALALLIGVTYAAGFWR